jgi:hypothetical protein
MTQNSQARLLSPVLSPAAMSSSASATVRDIARYLSSLVILNRRRVRRWAHTTRKVVPCAAEPGRVDTPDLIQVSDERATAARELRQTVT